jgi:hypothetical protein
MPGVPIIDSTFTQVNPSHLVTVSSVDSPLTAPTHFPIAHHDIEPLVFTEPESDQLSGPLCSVPNNPKHPL